jgi:phospholipase/carboxylesterase
MFENLVRLVVLQRVDTLVAEVVAGGRSPGSVHLVGFSQGACLVAEHLWRRAPDVAGAAVRTGARLGRRGQRAPAGPTLQGVRVVLSAPAHDEWVPAECVRDTADALAGRGADVDCWIHPGTAHGITDGEVDRVVALLLGQPLPQVTAA